MSHPQREEEGDDEEAKLFLTVFKPLSSYVLTMVVKATIELGVFDVLAIAGPNAELTTGEITEKFHVSIDEKGASILDNMLEFLAVHSFLTCSSTIDKYGHSWKRYGLTPMSRLMTNIKDGFSITTNLLLEFQKDFIDCWHYLKEAVQDGVNPFRRAHGMSMYEYMTKNPSLAMMFNNGMKNQTNLATKHIVKEYKDGLMQIKNLIDVGGGFGATLAGIISKFPHIQGINFDLPHVIENAPLIPGVEHVGGDMFDMIPSGGDILLKFVLHNWDDERCLVILRNCWRALPTSGKVIIVELMLPESVETSDDTISNFYTSNLVMMVLCEGGKERTEKEFRLLAKAASFSEFKISGKSWNFYIMELIK